MKTIVFSRDLMDNEEFRKPCRIIVNDRGNTNPTLSQWLEKRFSLPLDNQRELSEMGSTSVITKIPLGVDHEILVKVYVCSCDSGYEAIVTPLRGILPLHPLLNIDPLTNIDLGLILVAGPRNSGRTMSLASFAQHYLNLADKSEKPLRILTLGRQIEYPLSASGSAAGNSIIIQRRQGEHYLFLETAISEAADSHPDVVIIDDLYGQEAVQEALRLAESCLVIAAVEGFNSQSAIENFINEYGYGGAKCPTQYPARFKQDFSRVLRAVISQRLVEGQNSEAILALEIMIATPNIKDMIIEGKAQRLPSFIQTGYNWGMRLLDKSLLVLFREGKITKAEALKWANDKDWVIALQK